MSHVTSGAGVRRALSACAAAVCLAATLCSLLPSHARAQSGVRGPRSTAPRPWVPPGTDTLVIQVADAKVKFQTNRGDSIGGGNYKAYETVGLAARRVLRMIGRENMTQARAVEAVLDSLGLDTDILIDPEMPIFAFLLVRNPYKLDAKAVGFLYWWKGDDLRMQGAQFSGGTHPQMRVWWTGEETFPYSWGIVDFARDDGDMHFSLFRLTTTGMFWTLAQYEDSGYRIGGTGTTSWVDLNGDQKPELVAYMPGERDSLFQDCKDCPKPVAELTFAERRQGFAIQDTRIVPSPYSTFEHFLRLLVEGNHSAAARLLDDPAKLANAVANGWTSKRSRSWKVDYAEPGTSWPAWMVVRFFGPQRPHRYTVYFQVKNGRWVIKDWIERELEPTIGPQPHVGPVPLPTARGTARSRPARRDSVLQKKGGP